MRTTVTLDPDAEQIIRRRMAERKVSFKQALNDLLRQAESTREEQQPFRTKTRSLGMLVPDLHKALQLAGELEDEEIIRKMRTGR